MAGSHMADLTAMAGDPAAVCGDYGHVVADDAGANA
jgi:hypothetical protein